MISAPMTMDYIRPSAIASIAEIQVIRYLEAVVTLLSILLTQATFLRESRFRPAVYLRAAAKRGCCRRDAKC